MRDYGTGVWEGGDEGCDHVEPRHPKAKDMGLNERWGNASGERKQETAKQTQYRVDCLKCGASRIDQQLGLEESPDAYIANMVAVFREVHRVLADHGTCWVNIGDSYANGPPSGTAGQWNGSSPLGGNRNAEASVKAAQQVQRPPGLKPKDLVGIPWRLAFALQADGWYLRADIIWAKPNPMPESVTDRPTKAHEYVFLLSKRAKYHFDQEAVREPHSPPKQQSFARTRRTFGVQDPNPVGGRQSLRQPGMDYTKNTSLDPDSAGRNVRSVWEIATQPYAEAHFATYPEELVRRCLLAGCPERVCVSCGRPSERIVEAEGTYGDRKALGYDKPANMKVGVHEGHHNVIHPPGMTHDLTPKARKDLGWSDCGHDTWRVGTVLDPFLGSGTTALVARKHGRRCVGIELNHEYAELAVRRNAQQTIWTTA